MVGGPQDLYVCQAAPGGAEGGETQRSMVAAEGAGYPSEVLAELADLHFVV